jgi:hypothetical protein
MNHHPTRIHRTGFPHMSKGLWIVALTIASWLPFVLAVEAVKAALRGML